MIWRIITIAFVIVTLLYYIVCLLEIFRVIKWTPKGTIIQFPEFLIPLYYFFKK